MQLSIFTNFNSVEMPFFTLKKWPVLTTAIIYYQNTQNKSSKNFKFFDLFLNFFAVFLSSFFQTEYVVFLCFLTTIRCKLITFYFLIKYKKIIVRKRYTKIRRLKFCNLPRFLNTLTDNARGELALLLSRDNLQHCYNRAFYSSRQTFL